MRGCRPHSKITAEQFEDCRFRCSVSSHRNPVTPGGKQIVSPKPPDDRLGTYIISQTLSKRSKGAKFEDNRNRFCRSYNEVGKGGIECRVR